MAAYLAGLPTLSVAAVAAGLLGDVIIARGVPPSVGELVVGAGLIALGAAGYSREREAP